MTTHTVEAMHIYADTPEGRLPFTYLVFGPYANGCYDVEIHYGHVTHAQASPDSYITTVSDLPRNTHVVSDMWDTMEDVAQGRIVPERADDEEVSRYDWRNDWVTGRR